MPGSTPTTDSLNITSGNDKLIVIEETDLVSHSLT